MVTYELIGYLDSQAERLAGADEVEAINRYAEIYLDDYDYVEIYKVTKTLIDVVDDVEDL